MEYRLIRSKRKTLALTLDGEGLSVRAPLHASRREIEAFVEKNAAWIEKKRAELERRLALSPLAGAGLGEKELAALKRRAKEVFSERVSIYAPIIGVAPSQLSVRAQKTRWGSCSSRGALSFNCLLLLAPIEALDSVVVHELCHMKEPNHSARFYRLVNAAFPQYERWSAYLKENGAALLARLPRGGDGAEQKYGMMRKSEI